jgi:hypothetical protein
MIKQGSEILNIKTNTKHIVDGIETINNEKLIFTKDVKCFRYEEATLVLNVDEVQSSFFLITKSISEGRMNYDGFAIPDPLPKLETKKNIFTRIWEKLLPSF